MSERKPCPFCGSTKLDYETSIEDRDSWQTNIVCNGCGSTGPWLYLKESELPKEAFEKVEGKWINTLPQKALDLWNKRS